METERRWKNEEEEFWDGGEIEKPEVWTTQKGNDLSDEKKNKRVCKKDKDNNKQK